MGGRFKVLWMLLTYFSSIRFVLFLPSDVSSFSHFDPVSLLRFRGDREGLSIHKSQ